MDDLHSSPATWQSQIGKNSLLSAKFRNKTIRQTFSYKIYTNRSQNTFTKDYQFISFEMPDLLKNLLRNVIDSHSAEIQTAKLQRPHQYDDEVQYFDQMHPQEAPQWSYIEQEDFIYDTEIDSRNGFDKDEDYGKETEEVLIDSQKSAAGDDLAE
ncbi:hypothetical protein GLOIN_2v1847018 [Rhizophagus irregularis DAOM 181602=DAOM 197198]|uniref:Uncharacterized protein n=1 Tax=Rhizophagus irregularis (strain DAOM 197198w) TaxID=1432141 RepID=A0A015K4K8_RHIIW|nr:hypothetical protein RirG_162240 [Rhizophagus irregularis DAOM 197198w]GET56200.1 hypothetical protein GLOIN_2v1847018 [Rhizophagus irregularis DAOM 181602=DAOM 197198]